MVLYQVRVVEGESVRVTGGKYNCDIIDSMNGEGKKKYFSNEAWHTIGGSGLEGKPFTSAWGGDPVDFVNYLKIAVAVYGHIYFIWEGVLVRLHEDPNTGFEMEVVDWSMPNITVAGRQIAEAIVDNLRGIAKES